MNSAPSTGVASGGPCPLCGAVTHFYCRDARRAYFICGFCRLVHVPRIYQLSAAAERAEYDKHENDPFDPGYRQFLSRLCEPLMSRLPAAASGLDFGCGPGPALATMLNECGFPTRVFDKFYYPDRVVLQRSYDFITATEVVEHLHQPASVLDQLWTMLRPNGYLAIMTKRLRDLEAFRRWHYKNDPTHICFFHRRSFEFLANRWGAELQLPGDDTVLLHKPVSGDGR